MHARSSAVFVLVSSIACLLQTETAQAQQLSPRTAAFRADECASGAKATSSGSCLYSGSAGWSGGELDARGYALVLWGNQSDLTTAASANPNAHFLRRRSFATVGRSAHSAVYPGHFLLETGAVLDPCATASLRSSGTASTATIVLASATSLDSRMLKTKRYWMIYGRLHGAPTWSVSEEVTIAPTTVNAAAGSFLVERGAMGGPTLDWDRLLTDGTVDEVVLAPHAETWNDSTATAATGSLLINMSTLSPVDPSTGLRGYEAWADMEAADLASALAAAPSNLHGFQYDGGRFRPDQGSTYRYAIDVNNDLVADYGYEGMVNTWALGSMLAMKKLRSLEATDATTYAGFSRMVMNVDSSNPEQGFRMHGGISGIEMENFDEDTLYGTALSAFSEQWNHLRMFDSRLRESTSHEVTSYAFTKQESNLYCSPESSSAGTCPSDNSHFRRGFAASQLLSMAHPYAVEGSNAKYFDIYKFPEYTGVPTGSTEWGESNGWLGAETSGITTSHHVRGTYVANGVVTFSCVESAGTFATTSLPADGTSISAPSSCLYAATATHAAGTVAVSLSSVPTPTVAGSSGTSSTHAACRSFEPGCFYPSVGGAYVDISLAGSGKVTSSDALSVSFDADASSDYSSAVDAHTADELQSATSRLVWVTLIYDKTTTKHTQMTLVDASSRRYSLSFPNAFSATRYPATVRFSFGEEPGGFRVGNVRVEIADGERHYRTFEHGIVLLNASPSSWDISALVGGSASLGARDGATYRRRSDGSFALVQ